MRYVPELAETRPAESMSGGPHNLYAIYTQVIERILAILNGLYTTLVCTNKTYRSIAKHIHLHLQWCLAIDYANKQMFAVQ